jgi:hypothetical protein
MPTDDTFLQNKTLFYQFLLHSRHHQKYYSKPGESTPSFFVKYLCDHYTVSTNQKQVILHLDIVIYSK